MVFTSILRDFCCSTSRFRLVSISTGSIARTGLTIKFRTIRVNIMSLLEPDLFHSRKLQAAVLVWVIMELIAAGSNPCLTLIITFHACLIFWTFLIYKRIKREKPYLPAAIRRRVVGNPTRWTFSWRTARPPSCILIWLTWKQIPSLTKYRWAAE